MTPRLKEKYRNEIVPTMMKEFSYKGIMEVPKIDKVVLNVGLGEAIQNIKALEAAQKELGIITDRRRSSPRRRSRSRHSNSGRECRSGAR